MLILSAILYFSAIGVSIRLWLSICRRVKYFYIPALIGLLIIGVMTWVSLSSICTQNLSLHGQNHTSDVITVTVGFLVSFVIGIIGIAELRSTLAKTLRRNVQIIIGIFIGVSFMVLINQLETIHYRRYMLPPSGGMTPQTEDFVRAQLLGGFHLALWRDAEEYKHYLEIFSKSSWGGPMIEVSTIENGDQEEIISNIKVDTKDSRIILTDEDHDGKWDFCHYIPYYEDKTNNYIMMNGQRIAVDLLEEGIVVIEPANQNMEPIVTTPVELSKVQGTAGHP